MSRPLETITPAMPGLAGPRRALPSASSKTVPRAVEPVAAVWASAGPVAAASAANAAGGDGLAPGEGKGLVGHGGWILSAAAV